MFQSNLKNRTLRSALLLGAASAAALCLAMPAMAADDDTSVETVVVTGSRIPQQGLYTSSPVTVLSQQDFQDSGANNVEELLRGLPSVVKDGQNGTVDNNAGDSGGTSTVDIRGMGSNRTLVLVDGKRMQPSDQAGDVDLAQIPAAMIDHIDVLTGGASSVYGGDAVSGVVNLVLRKDFEGMEASGQYGVTKYNDGATDDANVVLGVNSANGKGNVTLYAEYFNQEAIPSSNRPWATTVTASPYEPATGLGCAPLPATAFCAFGSSRIPNGWWHDLGLVFQPSGALTPYAGETFDFMPDEFAQSGHKRYSLGANGHYEVNKALDFYARVIFSDNDDATQLAPIAFSEDVNVNCGNPLMPDGQRSILFPGDPSGSIPGCAAVGGADAVANHEYRARFVAAGNRTTDDRHSAYQAEIGAQGDLGNSWNYDISGSYGATHFTQALGGDLDVGKFQDTLLSDALGQCSNGDPTCYPADIFHTQYAISPLAADYFRAPDIEIGILQQWDAEANLVGNLGQYGVQSPWAKSGVSVALGTEYRQEEAASSSAGPISEFGGSGGYGYEPPDSGSYNVAEANVEVKIPVIEDMPIAELVELDGGYRYSSYSLSGAAVTWKGALTWQPVDDITFRGSVDRAVREPHISDLFTAPQQTAANGADPCGGGVSYTAPLALCEATGVPAAAYGGTGLDCGGQCTGYLLSNPNLKPEVGYTRSVGFVLTPTFLDNFTATVDYYSIEISGAIQSLPFQLVADNCYNPALNPSETVNYYCSLFHRDSHGSITTSTGYVNLPEANIGSQGAKGVDFGANYQFDLDSFSWKDAGSLQFAFLGTWATSQFFNVAGEVSQCAGHYDVNFCDVPAPKWTHTLRLTWNSPSSDLQFFGTWHYFTATSLSSEFRDGLDSQTGQPAGTGDPLENTLPAESYFDLGFNWQVSQIVDLYGGTNNVLNQKPPLIDAQVFNAGTDNVNTFPGLYDVLGRTYFVGAKVKF